jgi:hypothetical protein
MDKKAAHFPQGKAAATTAVLIYSQNRILCWIKNGRNISYRRRRKQNV